MTDKPIIIPKVLNRPNHTNQHDPHDLLLNCEELISIRSNRPNCSAFKKYRIRTRRQTHTSNQPEPAPDFSISSSQVLTYRLTVKANFPDMTNGSKNQQDWLNELPHFYDPNQAPLFEETSELMQSTSLAQPYKQEGVPLEEEKCNFEVKQEKELSQMSGSEKGAKEWIAHWIQSPYSPSDPFIICRLERVPAIKNKPIHKPAKREKEVQQKVKVQVERTKSICSLQHLVEVAAEKRNQEIGTPHKD